jgi:signal peptidase II
MLLMFAVGTCTAMIDQGTKALVAARLHDGSETIDLAAGVRLRRVVNRHYPWGSNGGILAMTIALVLVVAASAAIARSMHMPWVSVALGASVGGAVGNVIDGIRLRAVIDFIDLRVWPVFNLADAAIVAGALLTGWELLQLV